MKVIEITKPGGPEVLKLSSRTCPEPSTGQVLIKVCYAGVNRPDALQRAGLYKPPSDASDLPGLEAAGEIVKMGNAVSGLNICLLYTSPSPRDLSTSRMPSSA